MIKFCANKAVPDGSVSNIRSLIHLVLHSLGELLSSKEPYRKTDRGTYRQTDRQTHRHTEPINGSKFHHST